MTAKFTFDEVREAIPRCPLLDAGDYTKHYMNN